MRERAAQRDEAQRAEYWYAIFEECTDPAQLVFADETAKVDSVLRRKRGWGGRGQRVESVRLLHHSTHVSILACYGIGGFIDYHHVEGGYNAADFMGAVESMIVPHLNVWPAPGSILVLDNCRIHHTYEAELRAMVEAVGAKLLFLAPYCPIDNPILKSDAECARVPWPLPLSTRGYFSQRGPVSNHKSNIHKYKSQIPNISSRDCAVSYINI